VTPAEANQERRETAIRRAHRIDALEAGQLANFIHRLAAIEPAVVDRVLGEFDANAPKPRAEPKLHPVAFYAADPENRDLPDGGGLLAYCRLCLDWHEHSGDGSTLADLEHVVRVHSGIEP
jgi:hypothetical protein